MFKKVFWALVVSMSIHFAIVVYCGMKHGFYMNKDTADILSKSEMYAISSYYLDVPLEFIFKYEGFLSWWVEWYEKSLSYLDDSQFIAFFQYQFYAVYVFIGYTALISLTITFLCVLAYIGSPAPRYSHHYDSQGNYTGYTQY